MGQHQLHLQPLPSILIEIGLPVGECVSTKLDGRRSRDMGGIFRLKLKLMLVRVLAAALPRLDSARARACRVG